VKDKYAAFLIEFIEKVPEGYFPDKTFDRIFIEQLSTWEKTGDNWYCRDACSRTHLDLNGDMVLNNDQESITLENIATMNER
jgi:hypothetical protein